MNNPNDPNNGQNGLPQYSQYPNTRERTPPPVSRQNTVSGGELFVGMNLLSKIGVIFIIIGIIAFSAASEGFLPVGARLALVIFVGFVMLGAGELFYRKGSQVFANALIFGGAAELFICSLIGYHGFRILNGAGALGVGLGAAVIGLLLSARYRSQGLLIVTTAGAALPPFVGLGSAEFCGAAVYLVAIHCAVAVISRKYRYTAAYITGIAAAIFEAMILGSPMAASVLDKSAFAVIMAVYLLCCAICYGGGLLLNAVQEFGRLNGAETSMLCVILGAAVFNAEYLFRTDIGTTASGIALLVLAVIFAVITITFSLNFGDDCAATNVLCNFFIATTAWGLIDVAGSAFMCYILLHVFAAAVLVAGLILGRRLFRGWGYSLIGVSEFFFLGQLILNHEKSERLIAIAINLALWFGVMAAFIIKKKHENGLFRAYTTAAFLNAGLLCADMITRYLVDWLGATENWTNDAARFTFSALLCTVPWLVLGFIVGKLKYMKNWGMVSSFVLYGIGLICLLTANTFDSFNRSVRHNELGIAAVIVTIAVNAASVLTVLDMTAQISSRSPKFTKAVGLIVSGYALMTLTTILGTNNYVKFTSFIISILYIAMAAVWIVIGFKKLNALLRRFGLALVLLSSAKLFLFDFSNIGDIGRTLLFIGFGITLLCIAFGYGIAEKKLKDRGL